VDGDGFILCRPVKWELLNIEFFSKKIQQNEIEFS
jgi:hypothetical protein